MVRNHGWYNGQRILPEMVVMDIRRGGSREQFAMAGYAQLRGWSYRNMWWVTHNRHGAFMARGEHGQALYIDPEAEMVIARFASHPVAGNTASDPVSLPGYEALARHLGAGDRGCAESGHARPGFRADAPQAARAGPDPCSRSFRR